MKLFSWIGGAVAFLITIYATFHVPLSNAIQEECKVRASDDAELRDDFVHACEKQSEQNSQMLVALKEIQTDLKYIKRNGI